MSRLRHVMWAMVAVSWGWTVCNCATALAEANKVNAGTLSFIPAGVRLGMSVEDLQKVRPKAARFHIATDTELASGTRQPVDLASGSHVLMEALEPDNAFQSATYYVKEGTLLCIGIGKTSELPANWAGNPTAALSAHESELSELRSKTFAECCERFGRPRGVEAVWVRVSDVVRYLSPRISWERDDVAVALNCTSKYQDVEILQGFLGITVWLVRDGFVAPLSPAEPEDDEVLARLVAPVGVIPSR